MWEIVSNFVAFLENLNYNSKIPTEIYQFECYIILKELKSETAKYMPNWALFYCKNDKGLAYKQG